MQNKCQTKQVMQNKYKMTLHITEECKTNDKTNDKKCLKNDIDRYGRIVATCYIGEKDLNGLIVESGWGLAYRRFSKKYISNEKSAEKEALGLWSGKFIKPWEWRKGKRLKINVN